MKKYLVLGARSAIAEYFIDRLKKEDNIVFKLSSNKGEKDVYNLNSIKNTIIDYRPNVIINFVGTFVNEYSKSYNINVLVSKNLLDAVVENNFNGKLILVGSAAEYGVQKKYCEKCIEKPKSIYGLTKLIQHSLFQYYVSVHPIEANYIRLFNVVFDKIDERLFIGSFTKQVKKILRKESNEIKLGNLNCYRDYLLIDDVYTGFIKIIEEGNNGEVYNLGMGKPILLRDFVERVLRILGLRPKLITKEVNYVGKIENKVVADITKIKRLKWSPKFDYANLIEQYCERLKEIDN